MARTTVLALGALAAATTAAVATVGAVAVNASPGTHIQRFQVHTTAQLATGKSSYVVADRDVAGATVIGHDVVACNASSVRSTCDVAFAQSGGLLYAHFVMTDANGTLKGRVTGGTGHYRHAAGTLTGAALSRSAIRVTLRYGS